MKTEPHNPVVTIVRSLSGPLGKRFDLRPDGTVHKESNVRLSVGLAVQHLAPTHEALAELLREIGNDPCAAIMNASFPEIPVGEEFAVLSEREIEERLGIPATDRAAQQGIHEIEYEGGTMKAVGRFKENVRPSSWQLLDRDVDSHTPPELASLSTKQWFAKLSSIVPGVDQASYVWIPSASARVLRDGKPIGGGNGHVWVDVLDPDDIERARSTILLRAMQAELSWAKPRYSRRSPGEVVGQSQTTIIDPSVWVPGRLVFAGKPTVGEGLTIEPMSAEVRIGTVDELDTSAMEMPDSKAIRELAARGGVAYQVDEVEGRLRITADDLTLDTEIEAEDGTKTVLERFEAGLPAKLRCQTPFRASESWAAFLSASKDGMPFVYDVGTGITHWLNDAEQNKLYLARASAVIDKALPAVKADGAAVLEDEVIVALAAIKQANPAEYQRQRAILKQANNQVSLMALDRAVKSREAVKGTAQTHHGYAMGLLEDLTEGSWKPVGMHGVLFIVDPDTNLWVERSVDALIKRVADMYDGQEHCNRRADYKAISEHAISLADDREFFASAAIGVACPGGFYEIVENGIRVVPLVPEHRQRVMLPFTPAPDPIPQFETFLHETFASDTPGEEQQQVTLVQELAGAIMLGLMPGQQKAALLYDPIGRSGKGTSERIFRGLVPASFVAAISPFRWSHDYHVAALAGKRLNVVGELPENEAIPAAAFKSVIGGDLVTGRHPTHRPITFTNEAAHIFMSNHLITTKDHTEAFYSRWIILEFPNSRLRSGLPIDPGLAERIIGNEMPGIAFWALEGANRLIANGRFSRSMAHDRLMEKWRLSTSSPSEFIHECCERSPDACVRRSDFYRRYVTWCAETGRKPYSKGRVKELLEHNIALGVRLAELNGHEVFRGLKLKDDDAGFDPIPRY